MVELIWDNKKEMLEEVNSEYFLKTDKHFEYDKDESRDFNTTENLYIEGDNLDALKLLQKDYNNKIKIIYIDPPYNTEKKFIYNDTFRNKRKKECRHSGWINMMYPRLKLAKDLLSEDGAIFISIDKKEHDNLKIICDEIFGEENFISDVIWRSSDNSNNNALTFSEDHNYILVYSKCSNWKPNFLNDLSKRKHFKNPDNDPRGPWFDGNPVNNPGLRTNLQYDITTPSGKIIKHPANGWRWSRETVDEKLKTGELRFSEDETRLIRRTYLYELKGLPPSSLWNDFDTTGHTRKAKYELKSLFPEIPVVNLFSTPKPTLLIDYILKLATEKQSIVLDFFSGSATTAHSVMQLNANDNGNRKFIMVQLPEECKNKNLGYDNICEIGKERIRRAGDKIVEENKDKEGIENLDIGFKVIKIK